MDLSPIVPSMLAACEVLAVQGLDGALNLVAAAAPRHRFLTASWYRAAIGERAGARTIIARDGARRPLIALPIVRSRWGIAMVPGAYWPLRSFPIAAGAGDGEAVALLRAPASRRALGIAWRLGPVHGDDPALALLRRNAGRAAWTLLERPIATSYRLDLAAASGEEGGWPRNSTLRKNRFHEKHLGAHGVLEWRFVSGEGWTDQIFADLAEIERRSWVGKAADADTKFLDPAMAAIWRRLAEEPEQAARMRCAILYVGGEPAAFSFDLEDGETKYAIANSYDPSYAKHSPGKCLYYRNLIEAAGRGIAMVDWGAGDSGYKRTIGAVAGPAILDALMLRGRIGAMIGWVLARLPTGWRRAG